MDCDFLGLKPHSSCPEEKVQFQSCANTKPPRVTLYYTPRCSVEKDKPGDFIYACIVVENCNDKEAFYDFEIYVDFDDKIRVADIDAYIKLGYRWVSLTECQKRANLGVILPQTQKTLCIKYRLSQKFPLEFNTQPSATASLIYGCTWTYKYDDRNNLVTAPITVYNIPCG